MVPGFLFDSYKRYKAGTSKFLTWLVENAFASARLAGQPMPKTRSQGPRPKGKARRSAKEQLTAGTHIVAISYIIPLAQGLVGNDKVPVQVPRSVVGILQKTIAAREECAVWFEAQAIHKPLMLESVKRHSHFVSVLAQTLEILAPYIAPEKAGRAGQNDPEKGKSAKPTPTHSNMFANLEIEDLDLQDDGNASDSQARNLDKAPALAQESNGNVYEAEIPNEDVVFAVYCVFQDFDRIQEYVCQLWKDYLKGHISLINASATSNTAVEVVEGIEMGFFSSFPTFSNWEEVMKSLHFSRATPGRLESADEIARTLNLKIFYSLPHQCLQEWCTQGCYAKGGVYDPRVDQSELSGDEIARRNFILLHEVLFEYLPLIYGRLPTEDALTIGLRSLLETRKIHIWVAFALQMFLDINSILGSKAGDGLKELQEAGIIIRASLEDYLSYSPKLEGSWPDDNLENLRGLSEFIHEFIMNDSIMARRDEIFGKDIFGPGKPFYLLSQHPMLCGLFKFAITLKHQQGGMVKVNERGIVMAAAHLYNAAQQDGSLSTSWVTMDDLITLWNPDQIYFGGKPEEPEAWYKRYRLVQGIPAEYLARNRRTRKDITPSKKGYKRGYKEPFQYPPLMWTLLERYCKTEPHSSGMTMEEVELLLSKRNHDQEYAGSRSNRLRNQWDKSHRLSPVQLLDVLRDWIAEEEPKMQFNYFGIYKHCLGLLCSLVRAMHEHFEPWLGSKLVDINGAAYALPQFIFGLCISLDSSDRKAGKATLKRVGQAIEVSIEVAKRQESVLLEQNKREMEEETPPELSAATLWGILEPNHLTHFGECIHVGICKRQMGSVKREDLPENMRHSAFGKSLLALNGSAIGGDED